ncbi:MAG: bifunctional nuclease domain-containing protein, partial [Acidimicrobiia bacterium]
MIEMSLVGVRVEVPTNQPIVLLREGESGSGGRYLPIFIGPPEATAIVYALQGMETPRPMT